MIAEEIIQQIISKNPEVSRSQILENVGIEKNKTGGLIADETLLRLIAARYGIETIQCKDIRDLSISDLVAGLNDVTLTGRAVVVHPPRSFKGERSGKFANLMIVDKDAILRVVLWNEKADAVESGKLKAGQIIRFHHGYTRKDRKGRVEFHLSSKSQIEVEPQDIKADEYPSIGKFVTPINKLNTAQKNVHLAGKVKEVFPASTFTRSNTSEGKVMRFTLGDETGEIPVVIWNEKAEELEKAVKVNANLQLINVRIKENGSGKLEVHVNSCTHVEVSESPNS
jgi:replication factor A1